MTNGIESLGRIRLQGIVLLVVALGVGAIGGAAAERIRASRAALPAGPDFMRPPGQFPRVLERLNLTDAQREDIERIFQESQPQTDSLMNAWLPGVRSMMDSVNARVRDVLTPEQREQLDQMDFFRRGRGRFGPGRRPPPRPGSRPDMP